MVLRCERVILKWTALCWSRTYLALLNLSSSGNLPRADDAMQGLGKHSSSTVDFLEQLVSMLLVTLALVAEIDHLYLKVVVLVIS